MDREDKEDPQRETMGGVRGERDCTEGPRGAPDRRQGSSSIVTVTSASPWRSAEPRQVSPSHPVAMIS